MSKCFWGALLPVCLLAAATTGCGSIQTNFLDAGDDDDMVDGQQLDATVDGQQLDAAVDGQQLDAAVDGQQLDAAIDAQPIDAPPIDAPVTYQLDVRIDGSGTGTVSGGAISCPGTCSATYNSGATVTLTASPTGGSTFAGWNGACSGTGMCTVQMTQARAVFATFNAPIAPNLMFVTSTTHTGNLGGLTGADAICQARATAAGLAGTYRAWLSTSSVNANTRLGSASGWVRVDGKPFANTVADIGSGRIFYPPAINELGVNVGEQVAMTNTTLGGVVHPSSGGDCLGFTSNAAGVGGTGGGYTSASSYMFENYVYPSCQTGARLYCFGIDRAATVSAPPVANARKAFERIWTPGGGIAGADAACQADATAAGLSGTYRALLATSGASALSRFNLAGAPWVRVDNAVILPTAQAWATATSLDTGANVSANGQTSYGNYVHWTGAASMTAAGTAASTCNNWTDTAMTAMRGSTGTVTLSFLWTANTFQCNFGSGVITCLEQ